MIKQLSIMDDISTIKKRINITSTFFQYKCKISGRRQNPRDGL
jgi:hypothetical protein